MSQTSATPGREAQSQSSNPGFYRAVGEEIDRELERAHAQEARSRFSAQEWQTRAEEAEHRAEEAEHRAEEAERELSRIQDSLAEFNVWRDMGQAYANVTGQSQDLNPAGQGEREAHSRTLGPEQDIIVTGDPLQIPGNPSNTSGTPMASTAPPLEKPATPAQAIVKSTWQEEGVAPRTGMKNFFATWPSK